MSQEEFQIDDLKPGDMSQLPFPWWKKILLKFFPKSFMKLTAWELDIDEDAIDYAEKLFRDKKIHLEPLSGTGGRGFIISIDNKMTLWFYQDGDHFVYDGFEMGEYDDGDVTVVDRLSNDQD